MVASTPGSVLALNGGSSSIKFAVYEIGTSTPLLRGNLDGTAAGQPTVSWHTAHGGSGAEALARGHGAQSGRLIGWLEARREFAAVKAIGHRVVHGMTRAEPEPITAQLVDALRQTTPYAPDHLPLEIDLIESCGVRRPDLPQVACFDTAFHRSLSPIARLLPIPRRYLAKGVQRYGFHGLSYAYLLEELARVAGPASAAGRVVLAHLGNGASLAAVHRGKCVDTTMGFTPAAGLVMSTRTGDLDPGLLSFLARTEQMTVAGFTDLVNHESGLVGVSETSSDMRELLAREADDVRAAEAVALFCYQAKKWVGAFAAALGGLDTLVFSAGIGERSAPIRARICEGLGFLSLELDDTRNGEHADVISTDGSRVTVRVIPTNEELMIARSVIRILNLDGSQPGS